jgi:hypothetical protein
MPLRYATTIKRTPICRKIINTTFDEAAAKTAIRNALNHLIGTTVRLNLRQNGTLGLWLAAPGKTGVAEFRCNDIEINFVANSGGGAGKKNAACDGSGKPYNISGSPSVIVDPYGCPPSPHINSQIGAQEWSAAGPENDEGFTGQMVTKGYTYTLKYVYHQMYIGGNSDYYSGRTYTSAAKGPVKPGYTGYLRRYVSTQNGNLKKTHSWTSNCRY